jgi:hypothetical protein
MHLNLPSGANTCSVRLERILTMVCVVQNYLASFWLCPSSRIWKFYKRPQRFGDWICLRPPVDGAGETYSAGPVRKCYSQSPEDGDRSSLRNVVVFCKSSTYQTMDRVQKKPHSSVLVQLLKKLPACYGNISFIMVFARDCQWYSRRARWIQYTLLIFP